MMSLRVDGVTKTYGQRKVLDQISFSVPRGVLTGFVGGNGAGKTTTMRIIMGVLTPDAGQVWLDDRPVSRETTAAFGYMPEERGLYPKLPAAEQCAYLAQLHGLDRLTAEGRAVTLLERLGLGKRAYDPVETLSLGNQQRAQIAAALVHDPSILILDEPFSGLDPIAVDAMLSLLREHTARGAAVLFSSHQLDLVERITENVVILAEGKIKAAGKRDQILATHTRPRYRLTTATDLTWVSNAIGISQIGPGEVAGSIEFEARPDAAQAVLRRALELGSVEAFGPVVPTLTEVFKEVVRDAAANEEVAA